MSDFKVVITERYVSGDVIHIKGTIDSEKFHMFGSDGCLDFEGDYLTEEQIDAIGETDKMMLGIIKPVCKLVGEDGNVFNIIGKVMRTLKREGLYKRAEEFCNLATSSKSYDDVLALCFDYVEVE
jgi:hypothetical protein